MNLRTATLRDWDMDLSSLLRRTPPQVVIAEQQHPHELPQPQQQPQQQPQPQQQLRLQQQLQPQQLQQYQQSQQQPQPQQQQLQYQLQQPRSQEQWRQQLQSQLQQQNFELTEDTTQMSSMQINNSNPQPAVASTSTSQLGTSPSSSPAYVMVPRDALPELASLLVNRPESSTHSLVASLANLALSTRSPLMTSSTRLPTPSINQFGISPANTTSLNPPSSNNQPFGISSMNPPASSNQVFAPSSLRPPASSNQSFDTSSVNSPQSCVPNERRPDVDAAVVDAAVNITMVRTERLRLLLNRDLDAYTEARRKLADIQTRVSGAIDFIDIVCGL